MKMGKCLVFGAWCLALGAGAQTLVDFTQPNVRYFIGPGNYASEFAAEQQNVGPDGLRILTDAAKEVSPSSWLTIGVPAGIGSKIDWRGKRFALVLSAKPIGRMNSNLALNFTDAEGETFQFMSMRDYYNENGEFCLEYDLNGHHGKGWGGTRQNGEFDGVLRFSAVNVHFFSSGKTATRDARCGEVTLVRIDDLGMSDTEIAKSYPRETVSREPISTDTMYPGAEPFPGAKSLVFKVEPAFNGKATLKLSHGTVGPAASGIMDTFTAPVSNGLARFTVNLPYETGYEFISLDCRPADGVKGPFKVVKAAGEFVQTEAEAMRLSAETGNPLHIVRDGKDERPYLLVKNPTVQDIAWDATFALTDYFNREVKIPFKWTVKAGDTVRVDVPMPLPAKGLWRVKATVSAGDGSKAVKETRFGYLDLHEVTPKVEKPKFRLGIHYHGTKYWPDKVDLTIAALVASGAKFTRCDYDHMWGGIERRQGEYDWAKSDAMIDKMTAAGLALDIIFASTPGWALLPGEKERAEANRAKGLRVRNCCMLPREGLFRDFCEKMGRRYGTRIDYYECGNEWDLSGTGSASPEDLLRLQKEAYEGLHAGCKDVCVIPNGWTTSRTPDPANPKNWNKGLIEHFADHPEYYDAWALHCHGDFGSFRVHIDERFLPMRESKALKTRPWLLNETALSSHHGREDGVARHVWMKILFGWSRGSRDHIWYNLRATGWFDGGEPGYGLITADYRPRAGYAAFSALSTIVQGLDFDTIFHSAKHRHLFRFRGTSMAVNDGLAVIGWDSQDQSSVRVVRLRTDAKTAELADLMGNRTPIEIRDGAVNFPIQFNPQALLLQGATEAEVLNRETLEQEKSDSMFVRRESAGGAPTFDLSGTDCVKNIYEADPAMVRRLWKGNFDLSAKVWLSPAKNGVAFRVVATDDIHTDGDGLEFLVTGVDGKTSSFRFKPVRREGVRDVYEGVLPIGVKTFGLNVKVHDDDGEGEDGWVSLRGEGVDPMNVIVE